MTGWARTDRTPWPPDTTSTTSRSPGFSPTSASATRLPVVPLNVVGDFGGGGLLLAFGIVAGLLEARARAGPGVDAAVVDGASLLLTMIYGCS